MTSPDPAQPTDEQRQEKAEEDNPGIFWRTVSWLATQAYRIVTRREYGHDD